MQFVLARAPHLGDELFASLPATAGDRRWSTDATDDVLAAADVALVASGTVTVQAALHDCPMVVVYRLSPLTYRLGRPFVQVDTFAMANLVAGRTDRPGARCRTTSRRKPSPSEALALLDESGARSGACAGELREVRAKLGEPGASRRAAEAVLAVARARRAQRLG